MLLERRLKVSIVNVDLKVIDLLGVLAQIEEEQARKKEDMKAYNASIKGLKEKATTLRQEIQNE